MPNPQAFTLPLLPPFKYQSPRSHPVTILMHGALLDTAHLQQSMLLNRVHYILMELSICSHCLNPEHFSVRICERVFGKKCYNHLINEAFLHGRALHCVIIYWQTMVDIRDVKIMFLGTTKSPSQNPLHKKRKSEGIGFPEANFLCAALLEPSLQSSLEKWGVIAEKFFWQHPRLLDVTNEDAHEVVGYKIPKTS